MSSIVDVVDAAAAPVKKPKKPRKPTMAQRCKMQTFADLRGDEFLRMKIDPHFNNLSKPQLEEMLARVQVLFSIILDYMHERESLLSMWETLRLSPVVSMTPEDIAKLTKEELVALAKVSQESALLYSDPDHISESESSSDDDYDYDDTSSDEEPGSATLRKKLEAEKKAKEEAEKKAKEEAEKK